MDFRIEVRTHHSVNHSVYNYLWFLPNNRGFTHTGKTMVLGEGKNLSGGKAVAVGLRAFVKGKSHG